AALGEDLDAAVDEAAPAHWRLVAARSDEPALPEGATPLSQFVKGPALLTRRLAQIGVVTGDEGQALQATLRPGQRLVSREGDLWRWDGYRLKAGAAAAASARLIERGRLEALRNAALEAEGQMSAAAGALGAAKAHAESASQQLKALRQEAKEAQVELGRTRDAIAALEHEMQVN